MSKEAMKLALEHAKRDERHLNHAETRYWCRMYRDIAEKAVEALAKPDFWEGYVPEPVKPAQLPFGVGGGLVAIKTLLSRDPCVHANTAIQMIEAILAEQPAPRIVDCHATGVCVQSGLRAEQPAPAQGWKLVPVEPTEDMWKAVNKLDDEMAAGSYDGKGCSVEQAWNCLLAAAPQPAQQEPVATDWERIARVQDAKLRAMCNESGGFEKLCEVMDRYEHTSPPAQRTWVSLTDEELSEVYNQADWDTVNGWEYERAIEAKLRSKNEDRN